MAEGHSPYGLKPALQSILDLMRQKYGEIGVTSGYRSPEVNARVGGAKQSRHMSGRAMDLDMSGFDAATRAALVNDLIQRGATGLITYTNSPNMLHVDIGRPAVHFMHDKSHKNIDKAPDWFRTLATQYHGAGTAEAAELAKNYAPGVPRSADRGLSPDNLPSDGGSAASGGGFDPRAMAAVMQLMGGAPIKPIDLIPAGNDPRPPARDPLMRFGIGSLG